MTPRANSAAPGPYHHGGLREALIAAAERLAAEKADWTFTLREVARAAGVSHNAPYNHFPDRRALLSAIATRGFEDLDAMVKRAIAEAAGQPIPARVLAAARAYVGFGVRNGPRFRLMFSAELANCDEPALKAAGERSFGTLSGLIGEGVAGGTFRHDPAGTHALSTWSLVHGLALLVLDGMVPRPDTEAALAAMTDAVAAPLVDGLGRGTARPGMTTSGVAPTSTAP